MIDTAREARTVNPPLPYRIGLLRRVQLGHQGRVDGGRGTPDPLTAMKPVTTPARRGLERELAEAIAGLWSEHVERTAEMRRELTLLERRLPQMRQEESAARRALEGEDASGPGTDDPSPSRRLGEHGRPVELIRDRRRRERERVIEALRRRLAEVEREVRTAERRLAELHAEIATSRHVAAARAWRLRATFERMRSLYDRALVRRHPDGDMVLGMLEHDDLPVPAWVTATPAPDAGRTV